MKLLGPKYRKLMRVLAVAAALIFVLSVIAIATGAMALSYSGVAVDEAGRLYLGRGSKIEVYQAGEKVDTIQPHVDKSYVFTVRDGELLLSTGKTAVTLDLQGNGIDEQTDEGGVLYQELKPQRRSFTATDGTVLYSEPAWANVLKPLLMLAALYVIFAAGYIALDRFATLEATGHLGQA